MKLKTFFAASLSLAFFAIGYSQAPDKANLDQFFDQLEPLLNPFPAVASEAELIEAIPTGV